MSRAVIISGTFIILYGLGLYFWNNKVSWRPNKNLSKWAKYLHYLLLILTIVAGLLSFWDDISFSGIWTTRIIIFGFLFSGIFIHPLSHWVKGKRFERYYFKLFSLIPILTAGFFMIPFLGIVLGLSTFIRLTNPFEKIYYEDSKLRVQSTFVGILGPPRLDIFEKKGLFERRLNKSYRGITDADSVRVTQEKDSTLVILDKVHENLDTIKVKKFE
jgi:hypothetical protein